MTLVTIASVSKEEWTLSLLNPMMHIKKREMYYAQCISHLSGRVSEKVQSGLMLEIHAIFYFFIIGCPKDHQHRFSANVSICLLTQTSLRQMLLPKSLIIYIPHEFVSFSINHSSISTTSEVKKQPFYSTAVLLIIAPIDWLCLIVSLRKHTKLELDIKCSITSSIINQPVLNFPVHKPNWT